MEAIVTTGSPPPLRLLTLPDGRRLACAEFGDPNGVPVLALHGTPGSRLMFALADKAAQDEGHPLDRAGAAWLWTVGLPSVQRALRK